MPQVTAVGHAAMLAAIQRYVPALVCIFAMAALLLKFFETSCPYITKPFVLFKQIPSTYGPERLDLLRQLEKVKEMETREVDPDENV